MSGHFAIPTDAVNELPQNAVRARIGVTVGDIYERPHRLLPVGYVLTGPNADWHLEPSEQALDIRDGPATSQQQRAGTPHAEERRVWLGADLGWRSRCIAEATLGWRRRRAPKLLQNYWQWVFTGGFTAIAAGPVATGIVARAALSSVSMTETVLES